MYKFYTIVQIVYNIGQILYNCVEISPIMEAAFPVGAVMSTLGQFGFCPSFLNIFSAQIDSILMTKDLPTPKYMNFKTVIDYHF